MNIDTLALSPFFAACAVIVSGLTTFAAAKRHFWLKPKEPSKANRMEVFLQISIFLCGALTGTVAALHVGEPAIAVSSLTVLLLCIAYTDAKARELPDIFIVALAGIATEMGIMWPEWMGTNSSADALIRVLIGAAVAVGPIWGLSVILGWIKKKMALIADVNWKLTQEGMVDMEDNEKTSWSDIDPRMEMQIAAGTLKRGTEETKLQGCKLLFGKLQTAEGEIIWERKEDSVELKVERGQIKTQYIAFGDLLLLPSLGGILGLNTHLLGMCLGSAGLGLIHGIWAKVAKKSPLIPYGSYLALATLWEIAAKLGWVPGVYRLLHQVIG